MYVDRPSRALAFYARTVQWIRVALRRTVQWIRIALRTTLILKGNPR